ncbi:TPA: hypothetical protein JD310_004106 [Morganella morganii]|uniref:hypothetical protein n=1 Tax=Morganella morganii TaxID=582 RepID=UPI001A24F2E6|nr:hypothetical protein [Morganella morganii]HDQ2582855.1 hypothetical protein [Morganella morganii]
MKISLVNGVVLNISRFNADFSLKSQADVMKESAERCSNLFTAGALVDEHYRIVAQFDAFGNAVGV